MRADRAVPFARSFFVPAKRCAASAKPADTLLFNWPAILLHCRPFRRRHLSFCDRLADYESPHEYVGPGPVRSAGVRRRWFLLSPLFFALGHH